VGCGTGGTAGVCEYANEQAKSRVTAEEMR
jgi:hypothetical protein